MRIGLLLGSFDPIHNGHIKMGESALEKGLVDKVFIVPTAQNPWKGESTKFIIRCAMIQRAIEAKVDFYMSPIELELEAPYYTYKTLQLLKEQYPEGEFKLIVGADVADSIKNWENGDWILQNFQLITVQRPGHNFNVQVDIEDSIDISSTQIRNLVKEGLPIDHLVHPGVEEIIKGAKLYK